MNFFVNKEGHIRVGRIITTSVVGLAAIVSLFASFSTVPVGSTGVVVTLGQTQSMTLGEGFHIKAPYITHIISMDNRIQKQEVSAAAREKEVAADAEANQKLNQSLTSGILDYQAIQRWNGQVPIVSGDSNGNFIFDMQDLKKYSENTDKN